MNIDNKENKDINVVKNEKIMGGWKDEIYHNVYFMDNGFVLNTDLFMNEYGLPKDIGYMVDEYVNNDILELWNTSIKLTNEILGKIMNMKNIEYCVFVSYYKQVFNMLYTKIGCNIDTMFKKMYQNFNKKEDNLYDVMNDEHTIMHNIINNVSDCISSIITNNIVWRYQENDAHEILMNYFQNIFIKKGLFTKSKYNYISSYKYDTDFKLSKTSDPVKIQRIRNKSQYIYEHENNLLDLIYSHIF